MGVLRIDHEQIRRANPLARWGGGLNIEAWLAPWASFSDATRRAQFGPTQIQQLADAGVRSVRLIFAPDIISADGAVNANAYVLNDSTPWTPTATNLTLLTDTINLLLENDIAVELDPCHIGWDQWVWSYIVQGHEPRWKAYLLHLAEWIQQQGWSADMVCMTLSNEIGYVKSPSGGNWASPGTYSSAAQVSDATAFSMWKAVQEDAISAIRAYLPRHWMLATDLYFQALETSMLFGAVGDAYTGKAWHYYGPFEWSHQGAPWVDSGNLTGISNLNYRNNTAIRLPMNAANTLAARNYCVANGYNALNTAIIARYTAASDSEYGQNDVGKLYQAANNWMKLHNQPGIIDELGGMKYGHPDDVALWLGWNANQGARYNIPLVYFSAWDVDWSNNQDTTGFGLMLRNYSTNDLTPVDNLMGGAGFVKSDGTEYEVTCPLDALVDVSAPITPGIGSPVTVVDAGTRTSQGLGV